MSDNGQWQVAGSAPEVYERELVPIIFGPWAPLLVDLGQVCEGDRVLDVACGTGIVSRTAARRVGTAGSVAGIDLNSGMLKVAQIAWSAHVPSGISVQWREASADKLPFPSATFDIVFCQLGLQFFPDRAAALCEMQRVLDDNGRLALMVWRGIDESPGFAALADALERHFGPSAAAVMRAPFGLSDAQELTGLVQEAGFRHVAVRERVGNVCFPSVEKFVTSYLAGSPLAGQVSAVRGGLKCLVSDLLIALKDYVGSDGVAFPIGAHLLSASK
jgi:ubiquinone/menaquinone biosynthesis C-methylase UbiE